MKPSLPFTRLAASESMRTPNTSIMPVSKSSTPATAFMRLDLPAPSGPMRP